MQHDNLQVIYQINDHPYGIRDSGGFLFFFSSITKYPGQDDRYQRECQDQIDLANVLMTAIDAPPAGALTADALKAYRQIEVSVRSVLSEATVYGTEKMSPENISEEMLIDLQHMLNNLDAAVDRALAAGGEK